MFRLTTLSIVTVFVFCVCSFGRTLHVALSGGEYTSVQAAFDATVNGDTVLIAAGTYSGPQLVLADRTDVVVSGTASGGASPTVFVYNGGFVMRNCVSCEVWSLSIHGDGDRVSGGSMNEIRRCQIYSMTVDSASHGLRFIDDLITSAGISISGDGQIIGCIVLSCNVALYNPGLGFWQVINNTFTGGGGFVANPENSFIEFRNNILWGSGMSFFPRIEMAYNASYDYLGGTSNLLLTASPFINSSGQTENWDLRLNATTPCWDAGDPIIHDRYTQGHGVRSDIGCFGGMTPYYPDGLSPFPEPNITVKLATSPTVVVGDSLLLRTSARIVPRY